MKSFQFSFSTLLHQFLWVIVSALIVGGDSLADVQPLRVVTTTQLIGDGVREIGGDRVEVRAIMGEGVDPHLYKASPGDVRLLNEAEVILYNGLYLEGKMSEVLERLGQKKRSVAVAERIPKERLIRVGGEEFDPHLWFDVSLWSEVTEEIEKALIEARPGEREYFQMRGARYRDTLRELHQWCTEQFQQIPEGARVLITAHDAFGYLGRAYGLEVHGIQGLSTESEASLRELNALLELIAGRKIPAVFVESSVPQKTVQALVEGAQAKNHPLKIGGELFSDSMGRVGTPEGTYLGMVRHNVKTITEALR